MNESEIMKDQRIWQQFARTEHLTDDQLKKFQRYAGLLLSWNKKSNLTAITSLKKVISDHFKDSLALKHALDLSMIVSMADVGSGGGFPGIPLAIKYPQLSVILIEVNQKKVRFLQEVIQQLELAYVSISDYDWRTFLRQTTYGIQLFCARASLQPEELIYLFKPSCHYHTAQLVYWASAHWKSDKRVERYIMEDIPYTVDNKQRRLILMRSEHEKRNDFKL